MTTKSTSSRKRGIITWELTGDAENVYAYAGNERNYEGVASVLGMTVYSDPAKVNIPDNKRLAKKSKSGHVKAGSANVYTAEIQKGARQTNSDILIPVDKIEDVLVNGALNGKSYAGGKIINVRGKLQRIVTV